MKKLSFRWKHFHHALYEAALAGDADAIAKLEKEADILFEYGRTILHVESEKGNTERVKFILSKFAHKNLLDKLSSSKHTALHLAIYEGRTEVAEVLIDAARHLPPPSDDDDNQVTSFQAYLRQGDKDMDTALHAAVLRGNVTIVKQLVEADPTDTHIQNDAGKTPMYIAVEKGLNDIAEIISTTCISPSFEGPYGSTVVHIKNLDQGKSPDGTLFKIMDRYALYVAALEGDADAIANLETQAHMLNRGEEAILQGEYQNRYAERVRFILREFAKQNMLATLTSEEQTALHLAAKNGHAELAEILIDAARHLPPDDNPVTPFQAFLRQPDEDMDTALHVAVMERNRAIVKLLVEADPSDTHIQNDADKTPMYIAVEKGFNDIADIISRICTAPSLDGPDGRTVTADKNPEQGGAPYKIIEKDSLYADAIAGGADAIAILEMKADRHDTILHDESRDGKTEHVRFILREFASKNLLVKQGDQQETALTWAAYFGHTEVVEILIDAARNLPPPSMANDNPVTPLQAFLRHPDQDSDTALHVAVKEGHVDIVKILVEADPSDKHIQNKEGKTPMYIAVERGFKDIAELIFTTCTAPSFKGPDGSTVVRIKNNLDQGKSPGGTLYKIMDRCALFVAAIEGDAEAIANLEMQADMLNGGDQTILQGESQNTYRERLRLILREFAKQNLLATRTSEEQTALHLAAKNGHAELAEILIDAATHLPPSDDDNPVTSFQAFLRQADELLNTALHRAVMKGHASIVKLLVEADKSDTHIQNDEGKTPLYIAVEKGLNDIVKIIWTTCKAPSLDGPDGNTVIRNKNFEQERPGGTLYKIVDKDALYAAAIDEEDADAVAILGMKADRHDHNGKTILHDESHDGKLKHVQFILSEFASKNLLFEMDNEGRTALHLATC